MIRYAILAAQYYPFITAQPNFWPIFCNLTSTYPDPDELSRARGQARHAIRLLEESVLEALCQLARQRRGFVRTSAISEALEIEWELRSPNLSSYATTVVLSICRRLHRDERIRLGRPDDAGHHQDQTTGWRITAAEYARWRDANKLDV